MSSAGSPTSSSSCPVSSIHPHSSVPNPSRAAGIICRRPIAAAAVEGNIGLRQVVELASGPAGGLYSHGRVSSSNCRCRSVVRARRRRNLVALRAIREAGGGGGASSSRSSIRIGAEGAGEYPHGGGGGILGEGRRRSNGSNGSVELVSSSSNENSIPSQPSSSNANPQNASVGGAREQQRANDDDRDGLLLVTQKEKEQQEGAAAAAHPPVFRLTIGGGAPKYVRMLPKNSSRSERADAAADFLAHEPSEHAVIPPWELSLPHVAVATLASVLFGYHIGVVNVPLQYIANDLGFAGSAISQGLLVSLLVGGAFIGCAASGVFADAIGRRRSFQLSAIPMISGAVLCATSSTLKMMLAGRFLVGLGVGITGPLASLYVSEISPTAVRGAYGSLLQVGGCFGILGALVAGIPSSSIAGWWRACFWIATGPAILLAVGMQFCAESPRWLFKRQQHAKAEIALKRLWGSLHVKEAMADLLRKEQLETGQTTSSWGDLFDRRYYRVVLIGAALFGFQQLAGINAVFYFSSTVFRNAGITSDVYASICVGAANLFASLIATFMMDRQGRRPLLIISFSGMAIAMAMQAAGAAFSQLASVQGTLSVVATLMYVITFAVGAGPVPGLLLPELFADSIRAKAMSIAMCIHWIANFVVGLTFLQLLDKLGAAALYAFFSAVCMVAALFVSQTIFETRGKTLDEIQALLLTEY